MQCNLDDAIERCEGLRVVIPSIHSESEANEAADLCSTATTGTVCWIALHREANTKQWINYDGTPVDFGKFW